MIKLVIFDLDGTLVDAYPAVARSVNYTLTSLGFAPHSFHEIKRSVGGGDNKLVTHFVGEDVAPKALKIYRAHHTQALYEKGGVKLLPGAGNLLRFLKGKGYKLAIASNRPTRFTRIILKVLGVDSFFDMILCADKAPRPKPYPDILWAIVKRLKVEKAEVLYVGDMDIDIRCGRRAGIRTAGVATGSCTKKELKDLKPWALLDKISMLTSILKKDKK